VAELGRERLVEDLAADDFEALRAAVARTRGPASLADRVQKVRGIFRFAFDFGLINSPVRYGPSFRRPSALALRKARAEKGPRIFEAAELRKLIAGGGVPLTAMVLLGVNCGFGNADCGTLPLSALDLDGGWIRYPRPKTGIDRRCPLWPETLAALRETLAARPAPAEEGAGRLVFLTREGRSWAKRGEVFLAEDGRTWGQKVPDNPISKKLSRALGALGLRRPGLNFYALRHTFETVAGESRDQVAVNHVMGHADQSMAGVYRERISDERLKAVVDHVHAWLWPPEEKARGEAARGNRV
jgi:integrase